MFTIGQKVVDQNGKVFVVESISDKDFGSGRSQYLSLRPCFESDSRYRSYVPSDNASELIRNIRTKEEARGLRKSYSEIETMCFQSPRERKMYFEKVIHSKSPLELIRARKSLLLYREERKALKKSFSDFDRTVLDHILNLLSDEMAAALNLDQNKAKNYLKECRNRE